MQNYLKELRDQWRPLTAALIGLGSGFSATTIAASIMAPHLLREFGWTRAEFAAVTSLSLVMVIAFPFVGRLTDMIGVRRTALIGVVSLPLTFIAFSLQNGDLSWYIGCFLAQALLCVTTTATVYTRIVVQYIEKARGLGLAIVASGPAITGAILGPVLNSFVESNGWREGYIALAVFTGVVGAIALLLMPPEKRALSTAQTVRRNARADYGTIFKAPAFWVMFVGLLLCNLPQAIALSQMTILLEDNGVATADAAPMISAFSIGMLLGRFVCGLALDRFPPQIVAFVALGAPSIGLFLIASHFDAPAVLTFSIFLFGLGFGAEGDLVGYLVARSFGVQVYGSVMGLLTAVISTSVSIGAILLSITFTQASSFVPYLITCGFAMIVGAAMFLFLTKPAPEAGLATTPAH